MNKPFQGKKRQGTMDREQGGEREVKRYYKKDVLFIP
jgi:hypothetical protein